MEDFTEFHRAWNGDPMKPTLGSWNRRIESPEMGIEAKHTVYKINPPNGELPDMFIGVYLPAYPEFRGCQAGCVGSIAPAASSAEAINIGPEVLNPGCPTIKIGVERCPGNNQTQLATGMSHLF